MTKTEAHQFVSRWRRIMIPGVACSEAEALKRMERSSFGIILGGLLIVLMAVARVPVSYLRQAVALLGLIQSGFSLSLFLRFREARLALSLQPITNQQS